MKRAIEIITAPIWLPVMLAWALLVYLAGWIDWLLRNYWMAGGER